MNPKNKEGMTRKQAIAATAATAAVTFGIIWLVGKLTGKL